VVDLNHAQHSAGLRAIAAMGKILPGVGGRAFADDHQVFRQNATLQQVHFRRAPQIIPGARR